MLELELEQAKAAIAEEFAKRIPTIGVIGLSGTGKSSTINAWFGTKLPVSHVRACTKEFWHNDLPVEVKEGEGAGKKVSLRVIDAPGLGEDVKKDPSYLDMYREYLPNCDVILWVMAARNRAVALDQMYLEQLKDFHERIIFCVNQVDLVEPNNWTRLNLPSEEQEANISEILLDRAEKIGQVVGRTVGIVPYSAGRKYNLQKLFTAAVTSCPGKRAWLFSMIKDFRPDDAIPEAARSYIARELERLESAKKLKKSADIS